MIKKSWQEFNQIYLRTKVTELKQCLQQRDMKNFLAYKKINGIPMSAFEVLCQKFAITPFARQVLFLCIGIELDSELFKLCAELTKTANSTGITIGQIATLLTVFDLQVFIPTSPLRYWQLVVVEEALSFMHKPVRVAERILHYVMGNDCLDEQLIPFMNPVGLNLPALPFWEVQAQNLAKLMEGNNYYHVILLLSGDRLTRQTIAKLACDQLNLKLYQLDLHFFQKNIDDILILSRLLERESILSNITYLFEYIEDSNGISDHLRVLAYTLYRLPISNMLISSARTLHEISNSVVNFILPSFTKEDQVFLWKTYLTQLKIQYAIDVDTLVQQFSFSPQQIHELMQTILAKYKNLNNTQLWQECRSYLRKPLMHLGKIINPIANWDDLALPKIQRDQLQEIIMHVTNRHTVYKKWGFCKKLQRGLGISALFAGPSGTGKTLATEVLANVLQLDLYHIDLSAVVSKYIGETEKNLETIFECAQASGAILLFDEADALFGKRSEVQDSRDRYANLEISYLLQRMEAYQGLSILTTNLKDNLDLAFLRRIRFVINFPFPEQQQRLEIWQKIFPQNTPLNNINYSKLSRLNISGGSISNIAINAAFHAAEQGDHLNMDHIFHAVRSEYAKQHKILIDAELS